MSTIGRRKVLDESKQAIVCSLVVAGISLRQAAEFVGCAASSIHREAERNDDFRCRLEKAKSQVNIHPVHTLQRACHTDWRAALAWMERFHPEGFACPNTTAITQREANQFVQDLIESIEQAVTSPRQRAGLHKLLAAIMPAAMRKRWDGRRVRRNFEQAKQDFEEARNAEEQRRRALFLEIGKHLPPDLYEKLSRNTDLLDPEEVFAQETIASAPQTGAPAKVQNNSPTNASPTGDDSTNSDPSNDGPTDVDSDD